MPEMARYCGQTFKIYRRVSKTCVEGYSFRRMSGTVLLEELRCDGALHEGCQRNCLYLWKDAWLEPAEHPAPGHQTPLPIEALPDWVKQLPTREGERFLCQSTELAGATQELSRWNLAPYFEEIRNGELSIRQFLGIFTDVLMDRVRVLLGRQPAHTLTGTQVGPSRGELNLKVDEWVEIKSAHEIELTLNAEGKNRGLSFGADMIDFTEGRYQVDFLVEKIILEETGKMIPLVNTVALKGVACSGSCTKNCPRNNTLYWREAWLKRLADRDSTH